MLSSLPPPPPAHLLASTNPTGNGGTLRRIAPLPPMPTTINGVYATVLPPPPPAMTPAVTLPAVEESTPDMPQLESLPQQQGATNTRSGAQLRPRPKSMVLDGCGPIARGGSVPISQKLDLSSLPPPPMELLTPSTNPSNTTALARSPSHLDSPTVPKSPTGDRNLQKTPPLEVFPPPAPTGGAENLGHQLSQSRRRLGATTNGSRPVSMLSLAPSKSIPDLGSVPPTPTTLTNSSVSLGSNMNDMAHSRSSSNPGQIAPAPAMPAPPIAPSTSAPTISSSSSAAPVASSLASTQAASGSANRSRNVNGRADSSPTRDVEGASTASLSSDGGLSRSPATTPGGGPVSSSPSPPVAEATATDVGVWTEMLSRRTTVTKNTSKDRVELKRTSTYSGKTSSITLRGTVFDLSASPFRDFPELRFKEFPAGNLELDKDNQKAYQKLKETLLKDREREVADRDSLLLAQQKREEGIMKDFQLEMNRRAQQRLKDFQRRSKTAQRGSMKGSSSIEIKKEAEEFERSLFASLHRSQQELEQRLLINRLKWIMPWFHSMRSLELMHYAQIHQLEAAAIEEIQLRERRQFEDQQEHIIELDLKGYEKQLKLTLQDRKKSGRPMPKEEAEWERELFLQNQEERVRLQFNALEEDQKKMRVALDQKQQKQVNMLDAYYKYLESMLLSPQGVKSTEPIHHTSASSYFRSAAAERESPSEMRTGSALKRYGTVRG